MGGGTRGGGDGGRGGGYSGISQLEVLLERFSVRRLFKDMYLAFEGRRNKKCVCVWGGGVRGGGGRMTSLTSS